MTIEDIAKVCYEANRAYCAAMGDNTQTCWSEAPMWLRESDLEEVAHLIAFPDAGPSQSHTTWLQKRKREGWIYGPVLNVEMRVHPCCLPYDDLPEFQRKKDKLFAAIVRALT